MSEANDVSMDDAVEAVSEVDYVLGEFNTYYKEKYPGLLPDDLPPPYVAGVVHPVKINGIKTEDFGINDEVVETDDAEVSVIIPLNGKVKAGEVLYLFWGGVAVVNGFVLDSDVTGKYMTLKVKGKDVPEGSSHLQYKNYNIAKNEFSLPSASVSTLFIKGQPGVKDDEGIDAELAPPVLTKPASGTIGPVEAKAGGIVTVPAYLSMRAGDVIYLYWGSQVISHEVTAAQVNKAVAITVPEATIKAEGDSDELFVYYFVKDPVDNDSEWSDWLEVSVKLSEDALAAPEVLNEAGAVLSSGELKTADIVSDHVVIQFPGKYHVGDSLLLHMVGTTHQDQVTAKAFGPLIVTDPNKPQQINVPFDEWWPLAGGSAKLNFTLTASTGKVSTSKNAYINILGMPSLLPEPSINKVEDLRVDAEREFIYVVIPQLANTLYMDKIRLSYKGMKPDGSAFEIPVKPEEVSEKRAGKQFAFRLEGKSFVKPLEGGYVDLSYTIERAGGVFKSGTVRYQIGEPIASLPAPTPEYELVNKVLNPDDEKYEMGMVIKIPKEAEQPPCKIKLFWETSEGELGWDVLDLKQVSQHGTDFEVERSVFEPKGNSPVKIKYYYQVIREGKPVVASQSLEFTVASTEMQKNFITAPKVPAAVNNKLNLTLILNNQFTVLLDNPGLAIGDEIIIRVGNYRTGKILLRKAGAHSHALPIDHVLAQNLPSLLEPAKNPLAVSYELVRNGTTQTGFSGTLNVQLEGALRKESFESVKRQGLKAGETLEFPALTLSVVVKQADVYRCHSNFWYPVWGHVISVVPHGAQVQFELRGLAKSVSFDVGNNGLLMPNDPGHTVIFYTASGTEIGRLSRITYNSGKTRYNGRVSYTSPSAAIKSFRFITGPIHAMVDNLEYVPFQ
ncbi:hypothetical protein [Pseudomonas sp. MN1F]|uniref:hypothetical protein n=1 Tax=Pseudomonas sp. MN1F TaxID=1366632 RepID=UPI00128EB2C5|nr:hypothetical protein [Pseudomonas sp. MN1F]MQG92133.1 hypothetical protein [Pseudomonas sp. MN1F]